MTKAVKEAAAKRNAMRAAVRAANRTVIHKKLLDDHGIKLDDYPHLLMGLDSDSEMPPSIVLSLDTLSEILEKVSNAGKQA